jgi:hypothetical protein
MLGEYLLWLDSLKKYKPHEKIYPISLTQYRWYTDFTDSNNNNNNNI